MKLSGAQAIVRTLQAIGVSRVFGIPGIQTIELFDALADAPFQTVVATDERSAAFMADAHARVTGELGVLIVVPGPGLTNAMTGLAEAFCDSSPVLAIVAGPDATERQKFRLHDVDQSQLLTPITKRVCVARSPDLIATTLREAAETALSGEPGPVAVIIAQNFFFEAADCPAQPNRPPQAVTELNHQALDRIAGELRDAATVAIYIGRGAIDAGEEVRQLAERLNATVATTMSGRGILPEDHPRSVGFGFGPAGSAAAWRALRRADTLLSIGCKFSEPATGSYAPHFARRHIHIDINPDSIARNLKTDICLVADAKPALQALLTRLDFARQSTQPTFRRKWSGDSPTSADSVTPSALLRGLRQHLRRDAIVTVDSGSHQFWALEAFAVFEPNTFLAPADFQAMGFSIPAGIAAKLACPPRQVVSIVGDGGFLLSAAELATARRLSLNLVVLIFRDGALGLISEAQRRLHCRAPFTALPPVELPLLAQAFGLDYVKIDRDADIDSGVATALATTRGVIVDANVNYATTSQYFRGAAQAAFAHQPWTRRARLAARRVWREIYRQR